MAFSWQESVKPAGTQDIQCDIEYLDKSYIHVYLDGAETTAFTWTSSTNIRLNSPLSAETVVLLIRKTEREYLYIEFASGAPFIEGNVDTQNTQFLHLAQELVEGRSIEGFYGDINMHRYRITNLGDPVDARDAANKQYVDAGDARLDQRVDAERAAWVAAVANEASVRKAADDALDVRTTNLEQTYFNANTNSFPWWTVLTEDTDTVTPGMPFTKAKVRVNGVTQTAGYSYTVTAGVVKFAEVLPAGTLVDMTIGIDTEADTSATSNILGILAAVDGYSRIGGVPSFEALRLVRPEAVGQRVLLRSYYADGTTGGGEFVSVLGSAVDDGGHICVPEDSTMYWKRVTSQVRLSDYGVFSQNISAATKVDHTAKLQGAINRARDTNSPLITGLSNENHYIRNGVYITAGVDITGIKSIEGALPIIVDSSVFSGITAVGFPGITWVLTNLNATYGTNGMIFGTTVGNQLIDSITIRDFNSRSAPLGAQLHTFSGTVVKGSLCATGFNGPGVYLASCYDSSIQDIRAISCGNTSYWGIFLDSYPADSTSSLDTSNHLTIGSIEPHDCIDRCLNANASSSFIGHIHEEASVVTDTSTWSSATISTNGFGWTNTILSGDWTTYGAVRILPASSSASNHVVTVLSNQVSINTLNAEGNVGVHFTYTTPRRGIFIGTLDVIYKLYVTADVYGKIASCQVRGTASVVTILSATLNFGTMNVPGASSTLTASGCVFEYLTATTAILSSCTVLRGSVTSLTANGACSIADIGAVTLVMSGSRNSLKDAYISGTSTFSGDGVVSGSSLVGASTFSGSYTVFGIKTNANLSVNNSTMPNYGCTIRDSFVNGQLTVSGYAKVKLDSVSVTTLNISLTGGYLLMDDVQLSGTLSGSAISTTNIPLPGAMTKDPSNGKAYVYKTGAWHEVTTA